MKKIGAILVMTALMAAGGAGLAPAAENYYNPKDSHALDYMLSVHYGNAKQHIQKGNWHHAWKEIEYTLERCPNHPEVLETAIRISRITNEPTRPMRYLSNAVSFAPEEPVTRLLYGDYLTGVKKYPEAISQFETVLKMSSDADVIAMAHYKLGSALLEKGDRKGAYEHAVEAYSRGFKYTGLRDKLKAAGAWTEPVK